MKKPEILLTQEKVKSKYNDRAISGNGNGDVNNNYSNQSIEGYSSLRCTIPPSQAAIVGQRLECLRRIGVDASNIKLVVDVGCGKLGSTIELAKAMANARIEAFEPEPERYENALYILDFYSNKKSKRPSRLRIHNTALSDEQGQIPMYILHEDDASSGAFKGGWVSMFSTKGTINPYCRNMGCQVETEISVHSDTLDNWCLNNQIASIDILWLDAGGAEYHVLQGARSTEKYQANIDGKYP